MVERLIVCVAYLLFLKRRMIFCSWLCLCFTASFWRLKLFGPIFSPRSCTWHKRDSLSLFGQSPLYVDILIAHWRNRFSLAVTQKYNIKTLILLCSFPFFLFVLFLQPVMATEIFYPFILKERKGAFLLVFRSRQKSKWKDCETKLLCYTKNAQQTACAHVSLTGLGGKSPSRQKDLLD